MSRQDQYNLTLSVTSGGATKDLGTWDKMTGGEIDSTETKYRPGAMGAQVSLGGYREVGNMTISRLFDLTVFDPPLQAWLIAAVGKGIVNITKQPLDVDSNPTGKALVYSNGRLKRITFPEHDSESSDAGLVELEVSAGSQVAVAA